MFKPEEQQVEICLLKSNLEQIGNDLVLQRSALPALDAENEQKYRETMTALRVTRSLNIEIERLKLENVRLTAKRMQLKRQSDDISESLQRARDSRSELTELLNQEEQEIECLIRQYEDSLEEIADRFRKARGFYNEDEINIETGKLNMMIKGLEDELEKRQTMVDELKRELDMIQPQIPEDIFKMLGKYEFDVKIKQQTETCGALLQKRNLILQENMMNEVIKRK